MIDLHVHSTFSDGSLTPAQLVRRAQDCGVTVLALTDHDSTDGVESLMSACAATRKVGGGPAVQGLSGVEISVDGDPGPMHVLGYFVETGHPALREALARIRNGRELRNQAILARLKELGYGLAWEDVAKHAGEDNVGRPHFAMALLEAGHVKTRDEAFDRLLTRGGAAYVDRFRLTCEESLALIREAGGVSVLAHPVTLGLGLAALRAYVETLKSQGLDGVEVYYPEHTSEQVAAYRAIAEAFGLVMTGGSDFHGETTPDIELGRGFGATRVPESVLPALLARRSEVSAPRPLPGKCMK